GWAPPGRAYGPHPTRRERVSPPPTRGCRRLLRARGLRAHNPVRLGSTGARVRSESDAAGTGLATPHPGDAAARSARAGASPERVGEGEAGERVDRERLGRREAVALDEDVELAQVLRGMPGRALEEVVARLRAVVDTDHALEL